MGAKVKKISMLPIFVCDSYELVTFAASGAIKMIALLRQLLK